MWQELEDKCFNYIVSNLPCDYGAKHCGGSDSTASDIAITKNGLTQFYVEVKESPSQAGQFALTIKDNRFVFSSNNKCLQEPCQKIIDYLNNHFNKYKDIGQSSMEVNISKSIQYKRVVDFYLFEKGVRYFITYKDDFIVFKVEDLPDYFDIKCILRRKRSGSNNIAFQDIGFVKNYIQTFIKCNYPLSACTFSTDNNHFCVTVTNAPDLSGTKIATPSAELYFSKSTTKTYTITKLSKTNNPNIIFTLELIPKEHYHCEDIFEVLKAN